MLRLSFGAILLIQLCCSKSVKSFAAETTLRQELKQQQQQQQQQQQLWLECSCMHASERHGSGNWGRITFNATLARGAKNNCYMIFITGNAEEIVAFQLKQLQLRDSCQDTVEVFPYLREAVIENTTMAEYFWCNQSGPNYKADNNSQNLNASREFIYSADKVFGLRLNFQQSPVLQNKINEWLLNLTAEYRFLKRENFKTDGRLIAGTYCDYYFFANTDIKVAQELEIWRYFHSPRFPAKYPAHIKCAYKFLGRPESRVEIIFEELQLPKTSEGCSLDSLTIFDAESANMNSVIDVFCAQSTKNQRRILSSGPDLLIEFNTSSNLTAKGFRGKYKFVQNGIIDGLRNGSQPTEAIMEAVIMEKIIMNKNEMNNMKATTLTTNHAANMRNNLIIKNNKGNEQCKQNFDSRINKSGVFETSKLFSSSTVNVANALNSGVAAINVGVDGYIQCRYDFHGYQDERVQIKFHDFSIPMDSINSTICKPTDSLQILTEMRGKYEVHELICGAFLPKPIMSMGPKLTLQFVGKYPSITNKVFYYGFKAEYKFLTNYGITSGIQLGNNCNFVFNSTARKTGSFHSPNFPGFYLENLVCNYYFYGEKDERVVLRFTYFDIEGIGTCEYLTASDFVEFSNFMSPDRKYARYCGKMNSFEVRSDGKFFRVTFNSNDRFVALGFRAFYEFEQERNMMNSENTSSMQSFMASASASGTVNLSFLWLLLLLLLWICITY